MRKAQQKSMDLLWQKAEVQNKQSPEQMTRGFVCTVHCEESWLSTLVIRVGALFGSPALPPCSHVVQNQSHLSAHQRRSRQLHFLKAGLFVGSAIQRVTG